MSSSLSLSMGFPHGWVLSPFLFVRYTHTTVAPSHHSNTILKFADLGLISSGDETNCLLLNTKEMVRDW